MKVKVEKAWDEAEAASNEAGNQYKDRWDATCTFFSKLFIHVRSSSIVAG